MSGTFTTMLSADLGEGWASFIIPSWSTAVTSAETGPGTSAVISFSTSLNLRPVLATSDGLVVTPSQSPMARAFLISPTSAESMKNCMVLSSGWSLAGLYAGGPTRRNGPQRGIGPRRWRTAEKGLLARGAPVRGPRRQAPRRPLRYGRTVLATEAGAIGSLQLGERFAQAVAWMLDGRGRVVVTGMGKAGFVAQKISATLASTGTPSLYVHPAEAAHGDLGRIARHDLVLALSNPARPRRSCGSCRRCAASAPRSWRSPATSTTRWPAAPTWWSRSAPWRGGLPLGLAPTASTAALLALGDAIAMTVLANRSFDREDFALYHPAGKLGRGS